MCLNHLNHSQCVFHFKISVLRAAAEADEKDDDEGVQSDEGRVNF